MATKEHLDRLKNQGVTSWNQWRKDHPEVKPDLQEAPLMECSLPGINLMGANLEKAFLSKAGLEGADLREADLKGAYLIGAHLEGANLTGANLEDALLTEAYLEGASLLQASLTGANLSKAHLEDVNMSQATLKGTNLCEAHLEGARLRDANLEGANLCQACLAGMQVPPNDCNRIRRWKPNFPEVLQPADLRGAFFDSATDLRDITLGNEQYGFAPLADVRWNSANLAVIHWSLVRILGDEYEAKQSKQRGYDKEKRLEMYRQAVRAHRQVTAVLADQGLNEQADRFAYRTQILRRKVLLLQVFQQLVGVSEKVGNSWLWKQLVKIAQRVRKFVAWLGRLGTLLLSLFLDVLAGYGYRPGRALFWYLVVIFGFMTAYSRLGLPLFPDAFFFSIASFHGRGFFPVDISSLHISASRNTVEVLAGTEAVVGLLIEISLVATFSRRFFGK